MLDLFILEWVFKDNIDLSDNNKYLQYQPSQSLNLLYNSVKSTKYIYGIF